MSGSDNMPAFRNAARIEAICRSCHHARGSNLWSLVLTLIADGLGFDLERNPDLSRDEWEVKPI